MMHEQAAELVKVVDGGLCQLTKPYSGSSFDGGWKGSTHYFIRGLLQAQGHFKGSNVI